MARLNIWQLSWQALLPGGTRQNISYKFSTWGVMIFTVGEDGKGKKERLTTLINSPQKCFQALSTWISHSSLPSASLSISSLAIHLPAHQQWHSCRCGRSALRRLHLCACSLHKQNSNTKGSKATAPHSSSQQNVLIPTVYRPQLSTLHFRAAVLHFGTRHYYQVQVFGDKHFPLSNLHVVTQLKWFFHAFGKSWISAW